MAAKDQLEGLTSLVNLVGSVQGKKSKGTTKTSGTSTVKSDMTQEGMDRVLQQILAGPGGVKDISGAARGAGLYNSSTETQLLNDLSARAAGELEKQRAGTTTTTDQTQTQIIEQPGIGLGGLATNLGLMAVGKPLLGGLSGMLSGDGFMKGSGLGNMFGGGDTLAAAGGGAGGGILGSSMGSMGNFSPSTPMFNMGGGAAASGLAGGLGGATSGAIGNLMSGLGGSAMDLTNVTASSALDLGAGLGSMGDFAASAPGFALNAVPGIGNFLGGLLGGGDPSDMGAMGIMGPAMSGMLAGGPVGALMGVAMSILGSALGGISIVCTALEARGLLDSKEYAAGHAYLQKLNPHTKAGYYKLFSKPAFKIANGDKLWTAVCGPFARQRTSLIARQMGWKRWVRYPLGTITKLVGEPICWVVGKLEARKFANLEVII